MNVLDTLYWPPSALAAITDLQAQNERLRAALKRLAGVSDVDVAEVDYLLGPGSVAEARRVVNEQAASTRDKEA